MGILIRVSNGTEQNETRSVPNGTRNGFSENFNGLALPTWQWKAKIVEGQTIEKFNFLKIIFLLKKLLIFLFAADSSQSNFVFFTIFFQMKKESLDQLILKLAFFKKNIVFIDFLDKFPSIKIVGFTCLF